MYLLSSKSFYVCMTIPIGYGFDSDDSETDDDLDIDDDIPGILLPAHISTFIR